MLAPRMQTSRPAFATARAPMVVRAQGQISATEHPRLSSTQQRIASAMPTASLVAAALVMGSAVVPAAAEASRSGGRMGGGAGFGARRMAPQSSFA